MARRDILSNRIGAAHTSTNQGSSEIEAKREALLKPRIFGEFLRDYDGNAFSRQDIALNVLESKGVPRDKTAEVLDRLLASAISVGFIEEIKGKNMCHLRGMAQLPKLQCLTKKLPTMRLYAIRPSTLLKFE